MWLANLTMCTLCKLYKRGRHVHVLTIYSKYIILLTTITTLSHVALLCVFVYYLNLLIMNSCPTQIFTIFFCFLFTLVMLLTIPLMIFRYLGQITNLMLKHEFKKTVFSLEVRQGIIFHKAIIILLYSTSCIKSGSRTKHDANIYAAVYLVFNRSKIHILEFNNLEEFFLLCCRYFTKH